MNDAADTAILGSGPAAFAAARLLESQGIRPLHLGTGTPSIWSIWSGYGAVYGPPSPRPPRSAGAAEQRLSRSPSFTPSRRDRWRRLDERRGPDHPYARLGAGPEEIKNTIARVIEVLPDGLLETTRDRAVRPGPRGAPSAPDLVFPSLAPLALERGNSVAFVRAPGIDGWRASSIAAQVGRAEGIETSVAEVAPFDTIEAGHPVRAARALRDLDDVTDALGDAVVQAASSGDADVVVLPPVIGSTLDEHAEWWSSFKLAAAHYGARVAEFPAARDPIFGWRLHRAITPDSEERESHDVSIRLEDGRVESVVDEKGREQPVEAVVLATGRWFSGGLPGNAPFVEPRSGAPIWLDGTPLPDDPTLYPPDFLGDIPWEDHQLMRAGLGTDEHLRVLDRDGTPIRGLYAAGRSLGGFNPFHDGCSLGVELVTAARVAVSIAEQIGETVDSKPSKRRNAR